MKKFILFNSMMITFSLITSAQVKFQRTYGDTNTQAPFGMCRSLDGGYIFTGSSSNGVSPGVFTVKLNSIGDTLWSRTIADPVSSQGCAIVATTDSGFAVAGYTDINFSTKQRDVVLMKFDKNGNMQWAKTFDYNTRNEITYGLTQDSLGGFYITGYTQSVAPDNDIFLIHTNPLGNLAWAKVYSSPKDEQANDVTISADGGIILAGNIKDSVTNANDFLILKTNATGNILWAKMHTGSSNNGFVSVMKSDNNELALSGITEQFVVGLRSAVFAKFDNAGNLQLIKTYGDCGSTLGTRVQQSANSEYGLSGYIVPCSSLSLYSMLLRIDDGTGALLSAERYGVFGTPESAFTLVTANDGGYVLGTDAGTTQGDDVKVIKTNSSGLSGCAESALTLTTLSPNPVFNSFNLSASIGFTQSNYVPLMKKGILIHTACTDVGTDDRIQNRIQVNVFPNPFQNDITIQISGSDATKISKIEMQDLLGKNILVIISSKDKNSFTISPRQENLPAGIYFLKIILEDGNFVVKKAEKN